jgi:hypothetical protein
VISTIMWCVLCSFDCLFCNCENNF